MEWFSEFASAALPWVAMGVGVAVVMAFAQRGKNQNEKKEDDEHGKE